ncbi:MAG TPA: hypothetical protein VK338_01525, partial [Candidatus Nitrosocosmicus sp.]|nr:hypothetical protein [Candidatus Nitrosocosmicus sp.]
RIYYEEPKEKKFLLFNSKVYRNIETEIIIRNINKVERINKDMNNKHPVSRDPIVYFGMKNDQLVIETTYKEILRMDINSSTQIKIHDISDPSKEYLTIVSNDETGFSKIAILIENVKKLQS